MYPGHRTATLLCLSKKLVHIKKRLGFLDFHSFCLFCLGIALGFFTYLFRALRRGEGGEVRAQSFRFLSILKILNMLRSLNILGIENFDNSEELWTCSEFWQVCTCVRIFRILGFFFPPLTYRSSQGSGGGGGSRTLPRVPKNGKKNSTSCFFQCFLMFPRLPD